MRGLFILLLLVASTLLATTSVVSVQPTNTQAVVWVRTNQAGNCTYRISTASGFSPLVADVDTSKFSGANSDARPGSVIVASDHYFVVGTRTAGTAADGKLYSRVLTTTTQYFGGVTCGSDSEVTFTFNTQNIPLGGTYTEPPPWNSSGFGNWAWPTINRSDATVTYADPQTGVLLKRVTDPSWYGVQHVNNDASPISFDNFTGGSGWTNPAKILNIGSNGGQNCDGTTTNCAQTGNTNKLFLAFYGNNFTNGSNEQWSSGFFSVDSYDDFLVLLKGLGSDATAGNRQVNVCLTYFDSATCNTATQTITLPASLGSVGFPANSTSGATWSPQFQFGDWGGTAPLRGEFSSSYGTVNTSGTTVTLTSTGASYNFFNTKWTTPFLFIQGSSCTDGGISICKVASVQDPEHLTLVSSAGSLTNANYRSMASGVLIWKTNTTGTVTLGAGYGYAFSAQFQLLAEGDSQVCNPVSVTVSFAADGTTPITPVQGNFCFVRYEGFNNKSFAHGVLFLFIPSTGEIRLISPLFTSGGVNSGDPMADQLSAFQGITFADAPWDGVSGITLYGTGPAGGSNKLSIFKATYDTTKHYASYAHPAYVGTGTGCGSCVPGEDPSTGARWSDDPLTYTNITPPSMSEDVLAQIVASNPSYATPWSAPFEDRTVGGYMFFVQNGNNQDSLAVISSFSLSTGLITGVGDTFSKAPGRWCGFHTSFISGVSPGYYAVSCNPPGGSGGFSPNTGIVGWGPHQITPFSVLKSAVFNTDTSLTASAPLDTCPANGFGVSGPNCMTFHTQDVCSHSPTTTEKAQWPCPYNAAFSQITTMQAGDGVVINSNENLLVLSANSVVDAGCGTDCVVIVAARGQFGSSRATIATGWTGYAIPPYGLCTFGGCSPGVGIWNAANATNLNNTWLSDPPAFGGHADAGVGATSGNITFVQSSIFSAPYHVRYNRSLASQIGNFNGANVISSDGPFNTTAASTSYQSYPSNEQYKAGNINEKRWFLDFHHMNPSSGSAGSDARIPIDAVSYSLVPGTTTVYKFSTVAGGLSATGANYKLRPLAGYAGRWLLQDVSGPATGNILTDSTPYQACNTLNPNECRTGSSVGDVYVTVPSVPTVLSNCYTDWLTENLPCAFFPATSAAKLVQMDASQSYARYENGRRLTMGLTGFGRQYQFNTFIPESAGQWGFFRADWTDGIRSEIFMAKLPPFDPQNSLPRNTFVPYPIKLTDGSTYAEVQFGYAENGAASSFYCTARQEACNTSSAANVPFNWESETRTLTNCTSGCELKVSAVPGRVLYYRIRRSGDGVTWSSGPIQVATVDAPPLVP